VFGFPIYSEHGRYGKYGVLTLYFSMISLSSYQTTPFHVQADKLNAKFNKCLSQKQRDKILKLKKVLDFHTYDYQNPCDCLNDILESILEGQALRIIYQGKATQKKYNLQFFRVAARFGQWYANAYDFNDNRLKVFRCDKIKIIEVSKLACIYSIEKLLEKYEAVDESEVYRHFSITVDERGKDIFLKENYKNMRMEINDTITIMGTYKDDEVDFITNYFINFGNSINSIYPKELKVAINNKLTSLIKHISNL